MQRRFVVLTMQRSGSNMLRSLLNAHPEVTCFGELFRRTPGDVRKRAYRVLERLTGRRPSKLDERRYRGALRALEHVDPKFKRDRTRFAYPQDYIDEVFAKLAATPVAGFKLMLNQHPGLVDELISDPDYTKILLYRANHLASYSSDKISKATGQGAAHGRKKVKTAKVTFRKAEFQRFMKRRERMLADARKQLTSAGGLHLEIEYLDLVEGDGISKVMRLLSVDPCFDAKAITLKRNPSNIIERFDNPEDVKRLLVSMGTEHWSTEQLDLLSVD